ncbi:MAG: hypothetical protein KKG47_00195 [Proteobacteria bacterium]|nr:hypothetical protein [Pseudomonadota bacterium]MBU1738515.1 hypothetical protein [Pseudomonadota bacterium]
MEIMCCGCNHIKKGKSWKKQLPDNRKQITHAYCPKCFSKVMKKIHSRFVQQEVAV